MKVLIAEDERVGRQLLKHYLLEWGHQVSEAEDGVQALEMYRADKPEVVITDWTMPRLDGLELAKRVRALGQQGWPFSYIIMLTARAGQDDLVAGLIQGAADDYVIKPFDPAELRARLQVGERTVRLERALSDYNRSLKAKVYEQTQQIRQSQEETIIRLLAALQHRDVETGDHVRRIGLFSALVAQQLGWTLEQVENIRLAAPMHDIGKIGVPDAVLRKPGRLTPAEFEIIKTHTVVGRDILGGSSFAMLQMAEEIAHGHHERWDGGGYPRGLAGANIPEEARIVALADCYDAMSCDRVYRQAMTQDEVLAIMAQGRGSHFDPRLYDVFMGVLPQIQRILAENT